MDLRDQLQQSLGSAYTLERELGGGEMSPVFVADETRRFIAAPFWARVNTDIDPAFVAGAHKRLGELYEAKGDRRRAVSHYLKFVELWKNADPELQPKVGEVQRRLARLGDLEKG